jgi:sucrose phosphorylase
LNITYVDAILGSTHSDNAARFLAAQAIQYALPGVPATYIHSLLGSRNWTAGVNQTGRARTINREQLQVDQVMTELHDPASFRSRIFYPYLDLIKVRRAQKAFHPNSDFEILEIDPQVFAIKRYCEDQTIYALTNISSTETTVSLTEIDISDRMTDLLTSNKIDSKSLTLKPYQYTWLTTEDS